MNIFVLHQDPNVSARMLCDKHVVKMLLETAQLLCSVHWATGEDYAPYKLTHLKHPCSVWARESIQNYRWLCRHGSELCLEYTRRYHRVHKSQEVICWCIANEPELKDIGLTEFVQAMPEKYRDIDAVQAYRHYYIGEKLKFAKWKLGNIPILFANAIVKQRETLQ
jgi:hypothetical protein